MKVIWEPEDIVPGKKYGKPGIQEVWMIGYVAGAGASTKYTRVSLSDGMIVSGCSREDLALEFNDEGYVPVEMLPFLCKLSQ